MAYDKDEKHISVPLPLECYKKLVRIADYEKRFVGRQASQFLKKAIKEYTKI